MEQAPHFHRTEGRGQAISGQAIPHTANTQGDPNEGDQKTCGYQSAEKANIIRMGLSNL